MNLRVTVNYEDYPDTSWLEQGEDYWNGAPQCVRNPENYHCLDAFVEKQCSHCGEWQTVESLGGIHVYDGPATEWPDGSAEPSHWETGCFDESEVENMPHGYFRDTLMEMLANVRAENAE